MWSAWEESLISHLAITLWEYDIIKSISEIKKKGSWILKTDPSGRAHIQIQIFWF